MRVLLILVFSSICFAACNPPNAKPNDVFQPLPGPKMFIGCEGNFGTGNSSLSIYNINQDSLQNGVYERVNNSLIGDVLQDVKEVNGKLLMTVNNSNSVLVADAITLKLTNKINIRNPRYIKAVANKILIGSLYQKQVYVVDASATKLEDSVAVAYRSVDGILPDATGAWLAAWDTACRKIYHLNIATKQIDDSMALAGRAPQTILKDNAGLLWVWGGNTYQGVAQTISVLNPVTKALVKSFDLGNVYEISKPIINNVGNTFYYLGIDYSLSTANSGVYKFSSSAATIPIIPFIAAPSLQYFYGLALDEVAQRIYIANPKGFTQRGTVEIYDFAGVLQKQILVGIGPSGLLLKR